MATPRLASGPANCADLLKRWGWGSRPALTALGSPPEPTGQPAAVAQACVGPYALWCPSCQAPSACRRAAAEDAGDGGDGARASDDEDDALAKFLSLDDALEGASKNQ